MTNPEKQLPYNISIVLPGLNILSNNPYASEGGWLSVISSPLLFSSFLCVRCQRIAYLLLSPDKPPHNEPIYAAGIHLPLVPPLYLTIVQTIRSDTEREQFRTHNLSLQPDTLCAQLNQLWQMVVNSKAIEPYLTGK